MKEFWDTIELKGIPVWRALMLLEVYNYRIFVQNPADKVYNKIWAKNNKKALEQALIELNYTL